MQRKIFNNKGNGHDHDKYLRLLSRGDLTVPSLALTDFIFQTFTILHYISPTIHKVTKKKKQKNHRKRSTKTFEHSCEFCLCESRRLGS